MSSFQTIHGMESIHRTQCHIITSGRDHAVLIFYITNLIALRLIKLSVITVAAGNRQASITRKTSDVLMRNYFLYVPKLIVHNCHVNNILLPIQVRFIAHE